MNAPMVHGEVGAGRRFGYRFGYRFGAALGELAALLTLWPQTAAAHPLGNFTVDHYSLLRFADGAVRITCILDYAEIPPSSR
jgi:nickel/cobalt transporter (NicO) family protein